MHIIMECLGSVGDVAPFVAVAQALERRGCSCELLTNDVFVPAVRAAGLRVVPISSQQGVLERVPRFEDYLYRSASAVAACFGRRAPGPLLVVNGDRYCASNLIAEREGLPVVRVHLSPFKLRPYDGSREPPYARFSRDPRVLAYVNRVRQGLGLGAVSDAFHPEPYVVRHVATFPRWLCAARPLAFAPPLEHTGFPLPPEAAPLPRVVRAFLERGEPPVVLTQGTAEDAHGAFIRDADDACGALGVSGLVLCPRGGAKWCASERLLICPFLPLSTLLARASLLVHHGGIGTAARGLEAGLRQLVLPRRFDQPDNAERLVALGVAASVEARRCTGAVLAQAMGALLDDEAAAIRARAFAERAREGDGVARFAEVVEREALDVAA